MGKGSWVAFHPCWLNGSARCQVVLALFAGGKLLTVSVAAFPCTGPWPVYSNSNNTVPEGP